MRRLRPREFYEGRVMTGTAIVYGGSGFIGSHVCDALSEAGWKVRNFDLSPSRYARPDQEMVQGDLRDLAAVTKAAEGCDVMLNFGGIADIGDCDNAPIRSAEINVIGCINTLEAALAVGCKRYAFASTVYVYSTYGSMYKASKQACEAYIETYQRERGLPYTILRFGTLYGRRAGPTNRVRRLLLEALETGRIDYPGGGDAEREFIHVRDAAQLTVRSLAAEYENRHLVLTGVERRSISELIALIAELLPGSIPWSVQKEESVGHYQITPYAYQPRVGHKMLPSDYIDLGQGILDCVAELEEDNRALAEKLEQEARQQGRARHA